MPIEQAKKIMAENIKYYMDRKGVSKQKFCADLGFKYTTFMDWINGVTYPRMPKVEAMANYFGILKSDLIEERTPARETQIKKSSTIADAAIRMKTDEHFMSLVEKLIPLETEQIIGVKQMLDTFFK